jgi:hypothetical protein
MHFRTNVIIGGHVSLSEHLIGGLRHGVTSSDDETFGCSGLAQPPSATWTGSDLRLPVGLRRSTEKI